VIDGQIDYSSYTRAQLFDALRHIDRARYPLNLANLERALAVAPPGTDLNLPVNPVPFPAELDRWNWGAFVLSWLWGAFNRVYVAFWALVPVVNLILVFYLGARGNRWAWESRFWHDAEQFRRAQRRWAIAALAVTVVSIAGAALLVVSIESKLRNAEPTKLAVELADKNPRVVQLLGAPLAVGWFGATGSLQEKASPDSTGTHLTIKVTGPKARGVITAEGKKENGQWKFDKLILVPAGGREPIDLAPKTEP